MATGRRSYSLFEVLPFLRIEQPAPPTDGTVVLAIESAQLHQVESVRRRQVRSRRGRVEASGGVGSKVSEPRSLVRAQVGGVVAVVVVERIVGLRVGCESVRG